VERDFCGSISCFFLGSWKLKNWKNSYVESLARAVRYGHERTDGGSLWRRSGFTRKIKDKKCRSWYRKAANVRRQRNKFQTLPNSGCSRQDVPGGKSSQMIESWVLERLVQTEKGEAGQEKQQDRESN
jgi:hypothetical protein